MIAEYTCKYLPERMNLWVYLFVFTDNICYNFSNYD